MVRLRRWLLTLACVVFCALAQGVAGQELNWRVSQPFPLLAPSAFDGLRERWGSLPAPRTMHALILARMEDKRLGGDKAAFLLADPTASRLRASSHLHDHGPLRVQLALNGKGVGGTKNAAGCSWLVSPVPVTPPEDGKCVTEMRIERGTAYSVGVRGQTGVAVNGQVLVKDILIVAMGDSYSAGEGAPDRPALYADDFPQSRLRSNDWFMRGPAPEPAVWLDPVCHRSLLSWQVLAALRLALEHHDAVVRLLHTACSGAEFFNGIFIAQAKADKHGHKLEHPDLKQHLTPLRDGEGRRSPPTPSALYIPLSQVNAVRRQLCPPSSTRDDIVVPGRAYQASWTHCSAPLPFMRPDALLLTVGGNDVGFAGAVGGTLLAEKPRHAWGGPFLGLTRKMAGLISPAQLSDNVRALASAYADMVDKVAEGALSSPDKTVLLTYPNPMGPSHENPGQACYRPAIQKRIKDSYLAFSVFVSSLQPIGGPWSVEVSPDEVESFNRDAFAELTSMIMRSSAMKVDWLAASRGPDQRSHYDNRLLCTDAPAGNCAGCDQIAQEPVYFCQVGKDKNNRDTYPDGCRAKPLAQWNAESPNRRLINSANDALLAQRRFGPGPSTAAVFGALKGMFHPTAEAHAVAADSAYPALCEVLHSRGVCAGPLTTDGDGKVEPDASYR